MLECLDTVESGKDSGVARELNRYFAFPWVDPARVAAFPTSAGQYPGLSFGSSTIVLMIAGMVIGKR
jgi:hypothetical protein